MFRQQNSELRLAVLALHALHVSAGDQRLLQRTDDPALSAAGESVGTQPTLGADVWSSNVDREVGQRVHLVIGELVTNGGGLADVGTTTRRILQAKPVSGARAASTRMQVGSAAGTYLRRYLPAASLVGVEVPLGGGCADLVWDHEGVIVVDELKSGTGDVSAQLVAQVSRFLAGGTERWGTAFAGVRLVPLTNSSGCRLIVGVDDEQLVTAALPDWLVVR